MANLILLEDEPILRDELADFLAGQGHQIDAAASLAEFAQCFDPARHSIAIVDLGLPDGDGLDLVAHLRARSLKLGIVILTARSGTRDKVAGLNVGADHYLPKTADLDELAAVVASLARRLEQGGVSSHWVLDCTHKRLIPPGLPAIDLSAQDFVVIKAVIDGAGNPVSKKDIVTALGDDFINYDMRRIDTQMNRLRRRTEEATGSELPLKTLRNEGYQFCAPVAVHTSA